MTGPEERLILIKFIKIDQHLCIQPHIAFSDVLFAPYSFGILESYKHLSNPFLLPHPTSTMSSPINIFGASVSSATPPSSIHEHIRSLRRKESAALDAIRQPKILHPIENEGLRLLILENISQEAVRAFTSQGFHVDHYTQAFSEEELIEKIGSYHAIGIRSKTKITKRVLAAASKVSIDLHHF